MILVCVCVCACVCLGGGVGIYMGPVAALVAGRSGLFRFSYTLGGWVIQFCCKAGVEWLNGFVQRETEAKRKNALAFDWSCQDSLTAKRSGWAASSPRSQSDGYQSRIMMSPWIRLAHIRGFAGMMSSSPMDARDSEPWGFWPNTLGGVRSCCTYVSSMSHRVTDG